MNTEEHHLCFLKTLQNIHLGQPRITFPSPFCVADVGQSIITLFQINKILKLLDDGNATGVRPKLHARGKGVQKRKPNMFTIGSSTS